MSNKNILVIGESCRDIFVYCEAKRLCPDIPVPVLNIVRQNENPGMAKNVHRNIETKVSGCNLVTNEDWHNITKTRYVHDTSNHTFFRVDSPHEIDRINLEDIDLNYKIIIVSDYNKGFLKEEDIELICKKHKNVFLDTKKILGSWANRAKYIKINNTEYTNSKPYLTAELDDKIIYTTGGDGCVFRSKRFPVKKADVKDSSGAGDSFIAGLAINYLKTKDISKAIKFANLCASEVVKHRGVSTI